MFQNLNEQARDCRRRAADCVEQAKGVSDLQARAEWMALHIRYLAIARGIEYQQHNPN
jgi:hypothetical protein